MNKENLSRMADYIETIPQERFHMLDYRDLGDDLGSVQCNSVGCIIGHCTVLDPYPQGIPRFSSGSINFTAWSQNFTGIEHAFRAWQFMFAPQWVDSDNTPIGAAKRIRWALKHGVPKNWAAQMNGEAKLCYL